MLATEICAERLLKLDKRICNVLKCYHVYVGKYAFAVTNSFKSAILETGLQFLVLSFIEKSKKIKLNTDSDKFMERA